MTHGARILVVDDEPQILRSLRTTLASHGYDVQTAATGEEALAAVDGRLPDLVVLDLVLPGLSGLEVCRRLRARASLPILVLSARGDERARRRRQTSSPDRPGSTRSTTTRSGRRPSTATSASSPVAAVWTS